jgi:ribonuclease PH
VALCDAVAKLPAEMPQPRVLKSLTDPTTGQPRPRYDASQYAPARTMVDQLAAISVGLIDGELRVDLDYADDSRANVDLNVAYTAAGKFVEVQGSAENGGGFDRAAMDQMLDLAVNGCKQIMQVQQAALR